MLEKRAKIVFLAIGSNLGNKKKNIELSKYLLEKKRIKVLKVSKKNIRKYGAVSKEVCLNMLQNINKIASTNISVAITGIAGPKGGGKKKPIGLVYIGIKKIIK